MKDRAKWLALGLMLVWGLGKTDRARAARPTAPPRRSPRPPPPGPKPPTPPPRPKPPTPTPPPSPPTPQPGLSPVWPVPAGKMPKSERLRFGYQRTPDHVHQGVDILAPDGSSVLSPLAGEVVHVNEAYQQGFSGYGKAVVVKTTLPGGRPVWLLFAHLGRTEVKAGDTVSAGTRLGFVGRTKFTTANPTAMFASSGAHLHFEASPRPYPQDSEAPRLDPTPYLERLAP